MKANVLLVDDEQNILRTMKICLESIGLDVTAVSKPDEALKAASQNQYDIAFFDLKQELGCSIQKNPSCRLRICGILSRHNRSASQAGRYCRAQV